MVLKLLRYCLKWPLITLGVAYATYSSHDNIALFVNSIKFYSADTEDGFIEKEHAFRLRFSFERNGRGNLESYLVSYSSRLPLYARRNGVMVGDAQYNFSNFISKERAVLCSGIIPERVYEKLQSERRERPREFLHDVYSLFGD